MDFGYCKLIAHLFVGKDQARAKRKQWREKLLSLPTSLPYLYVYSTKTKSIARKKREKKCRDLFNSTARYSGTCKNIFCIEFELKL